MTNFVISNNAHNIGKLYNYKIMIYVVLISEFENTFTIIFYLEKLPSKLPFSLYHFSTKTVVLNVYEVIIYDENFPGRDNVWFSL